MILIFTATCPLTPILPGLSTFLIPSTSVSQSPLPFTDLVTFLTGSDRKDDDTLLSATTCPTLQSDHCSVLTQLNIFKPPPHAVYIEARNIAAIDHNSFRSDLQAGLDFCTILSAVQLHRLLQNLLDQHVPATQRKVSSRPTSPWFCAVGPQLLEAKRERRRAERQWLKSGLHKLIFRSSCKLVSKIAQQAKYTFFQHQDPCMHFIQAVVQHHKHSPSQVKYLISAVFCSIRTSSAEVP